MKTLLTALAASALCAPALAGQVPNPINAPASVTAGDALKATSNPQQAADSGVSLSGAAQNSVLAGPAGGGAGAPSFRALTSADLPAGAGTVTSVGLSLPAIFSVSGSPVTGAGTLTASLATQSANRVWAGPASGAAAAPAFRALVGADLPVPGAATLGGVESYAAVSHQWLTSISTAGAPASSQPAAADLNNGVTGSGAVVLATAPAIAAPAVTGGTEDVEVLRAGDSGGMLASANVAVTNSTVTTAAIASPTLVSGHAYGFDVTLPFTASNATDGTRWLLKGLSGLAVSALNAEVTMTCTAGTGFSPTLVTALNSAVVNAGCTAGWVTIKGVATLSAGGVLAFNVAQDVADSGAATVLAPASGRLWRVN
jgi:hypothetical protein